MEEVNKVVNVLAVEDSRIARNMLVQSFRATDRYNLVEVIENAANARLACMSGMIDLVLMDVCTAENESGLVHTKALKQEFPGIRVIVMTSMPEYSFIQKAKDAGADSFWYKETGEVSLFDVMNRTMEGESVYPETLPEIRIGNINASELTDREMEVLRHLATGETQSEIAKKEGVSENTVKYHVKNLLAKTGYSSTLQLVVEVVDKKLILPKY